MKHFITTTAIINLHSNSTRTGYTFLGWSTNSSATSASYYSGSTYQNLTSTPGAQVNMYAVWKANTYTVTYYGVGGLYSGKSSYSTTYTYDVEYSPPTFTRTGYTLSGWSTTNGGSKNYNHAKLKNLTATAGGSVSLYAVWTANTYTITFDPNYSGAAQKSLTATYGKEVDLWEQGVTWWGANGINRSGYVFKYWKNGSQYYQKVDTVKNLASAQGASVTLTAQWQQVTAPTSASLIATPQNLEWLASQVNDFGNNLSGRTFIQTQPITFGGAIEHTPIGNSKNKFSGTFDGANFTINNITMAQTDFAYTGLFGAISNATIKNTNVMSANISGQQYVGALVGEASGSICTIQQCRVHAVLNLYNNGLDGHYVGMVGSCSNTKIASCYTGGLINVYNSDGYYDYVGGIVGKIKAGTIKNCYSTTTINNSASKTAYVGGIAGACESQPPITQSGYIGSITSTGSYTGLLTYGGNGCTISDCFASAKNKYAFVGLYGKIENCLYISGTTKKYYGSTTNFANWVAAPGTPMGFLPKGFSWFAEGGTATTLAEIQGAGYTPA